MTFTIRTAVVVSCAAIAADAALSVIAVASLLSKGPTRTGYDLLAAANHAAWLVAVLVATTGVLLAIQGRRRVTAWLVAAAATTLTGSVGLRVVGLALARATEGPTQQLENLNSLSLAMIGTGGELMLLPIAFAVAGLITFGIARGRGRARAEGAVAQTA